MIMKQHLNLIKTKIHEKNVSTFL